MNQIEKNNLMRKIIERSGISEAEAEEVLERNGWDLIDSMLELERSGRIFNQDGRMNSGSSQSASEEQFEQVELMASRNKNDESTGTKFKRILKKLLRKSLDNDFTVRRKGREVIHFPLFVLFLLLLLWFQWTVILLIAGLLLGCRYSVTGTNPGNDSVNEAMDQMADCAENIKERVKEFINEEDSDSRG